MTNLQQLHQKRAELLAEQDELSQRVPQMEAAWKAMPGTYNVHGNKISTPEAHAAMEETSQAASRLHTIPRLIETIEAEIAYEERCANAEGDIARHNEEAKAAEALAASLEVQLGQLTARLESLRHEIKQAEEDAEKDQQDAAQAIARATASGDSKAEKAAQVKLGQAMEAARLVGEKARTSQIVIDALASEASNLDERLAAARQQAEQARIAALRATATRLQVKWNAAVEELATIGAQLIATNTAMGSPYHGLSKLLIPVFGPRPWNLDQYGLRQRAAKATAA